MQTKFFKVFMNPPFQMSIWLHRLYRIINNLILSWFFQSKSRAKHQRKIILTKLIQTFQAFLTNQVDYWHLVKIWSQLPLQRFEIWHCSDSVAVCSRFQFFFKISVVYKHLQPKKYPKKLHSMKCQIDEMKISTTFPCAHQIFAIIFTNILQKHCN